MHNWRVGWGLICLRFILGKKVLENVRYIYVLIERLFIISRRKKGWRLNISPQYHANLTEPINICNICACTNDVVCAWWEDFRTFLYTSMGAVLKFSYAKNYGLMH